MSVLRFPVGCRCVELEPGFTDTSDCPVHPVLCEAIDAESGYGCGQTPGHDGDHRVMVQVTWGGGERHVCSLR